MSQNWKHLQDKRCEYYPCHSGVEDSKFNCRFCYCPAFLIDSCPGIESGVATILNNGWKDCSNCTIPHDVDNFEVIIKAVENEIT